MPLEERVSEIMKREVKTVDMNSSVLSAASDISRSPGCLVVVKDRLAIGIVTEQDIVGKVTASGADPSKVYVKDIMSTPVISVKNDATVSDAAHLMSEFKIRRLVVVEEGGSLAGLITAEDLAGWLAKQSNFQDTALNALARLQGGPYQ